MARKDHIDLIGTASLVGFSLMLGFNQVVIKVVNDGLQPLFFAGVRSIGAALCVWLWFRLRGQRLLLDKGTAKAGILVGTLFSAEFIFLFLALDLTTVIRTSVLFYSMPIWLALAAHFLLPGERITAAKMLGFLLAFMGVVWAIIDRGDTAGQASLAGDLCALFGALCWAGIALSVRRTAISRVRPEIQLFWQLVVSIPLLSLAALVFGPPFVREFELVHFWGLVLQIGIASAGFGFWFWLLAIYPSSGVASFSFLSPLFGIIFGWWLLGEAIAPSLAGAALLVMLGLVLINWPRQVGGSTISTKPG